jgi:hypothetical protein
LKTRALKESASQPARRETRIQHLTELHLSYEGNTSEVPIRPPDLSLHGMFVNTSTHFPEGPIVNRRFRLTQTDLEVQTRGEVRYCLPGTGIGVEFVGLSSEASRAIEQELKVFSRPRRKKRKMGSRQGS